MTPFEVFHELVHGVADQRYDDLPPLYAEQTDVRHPMAPLGDHPLLTREALREHFTRGAKAVGSTRVRPENIRLHTTGDPEVIVAEFEYQGTGQDGTPFAAPCVFVLRVRDGLIVESRDYIDHLRMARARGKLPELLDALR